MYQYSAPDYSYMRLDENKETELKSQNMLLARAYVINQPFGKLYPINEALRKGTIFANLPVNFEEKKYK